MQATDCMYFNGLDANGTYVITRIARRHGRKAEIWLSLNVPGIGFFQSPIHPDTNVYNVDPDVYCAGGLKYECLEPMKRWHITFNGPMRLIFNTTVRDASYSMLCSTFCCTVLFLKKIIYSAPKKSSMLESEALAVARWSDGVC